MTSNKAPVGVGLTLLTLLTLGPGGAARGSELDDGICQWLEARAGRPIELIEEWATEAARAEDSEAEHWTSCAAVWTCVAETHGQLPAGTERRPEASPRHPFPATGADDCRQIKTLLGSSPRAAEHHLQELAGSAPVAGPDAERSAATPSGCAPFLRCLLQRSQPATGNTGGPTDPSLDAEPPRLTEKADAWKPEFERLCAQVQAASSLSPAELQQLIRDCDVLLTRMRGLEDPAIKVYLFRLEKCRAFFEFSLQVREP